MLVESVQLDINRVSCQLFLGIFGLEICQIRRHETFLFHDGHCVGLANQKYRVVNSYRVLVWRLATFQV